MKVSAPVLVLAVAAASPLALAETRDVPSAAYPTIQSAVDASVDGDVVLVAPGDYAEEVVVDARTGIAIRGKSDPVLAGGAAANTLRITGSTRIVVTGLVVDAAAFESIRVEGSTDVRIEKLDVRATAAAGVLSLGSDGLVVSKCTFTQVAGDGVSDQASTGLVVEKCRFEDLGGAAVNLSPDGPQGSDGALVAKNRIAGAQSGILAGGVDVVVEKNRVEGVAGFGIALGALSTTSGGRISKNRVEIGGGPGVQSLHPDCLIEKNVLRGGGIESLGAGGVIDRNTVSGAPGAGIDAGGAGLVVDRSKVRDSAAEGIRVRDTATGFSLGRNQVTKPGAAGIALEASGGTADRNRVSAAATLGFLVVGTGNTLTRNQARGSGEFDLADVNAEGANTYDGNHFATTAFNYVP